MIRGFACAGLLALFSGAASGQTSEAAAKFEIADVHVSAKTTNAFIRTGPVRGGRYEVKNATMVDLIRIAYGFDADKILGGPNWLELDRFDVVAKVPADAAAAAPETQKAMLKALLEERFKLALHKDTKPLPTYALTVGKKPLLKEADGSGESGCKLDTGSAAPAEGAVRLMTANGNGAATTITLGPGMTLHFMCRNMTMAEFAGGLRGMMGAAAAVGPNQVLDETGLKGSWNFDVRWSLPFIGPIANNSDRIPVPDAIEKQLGLKLEQKQIPTPVLVVDSVDRKPSGNPPGVAEALPPIAAPTEFEVADIKPSDPAGRGGRFQMQPGGRFISQGMPFRVVLNRAFNTNNNQEIAGVPKWADTERFDITAKASAGALPGGAMDLDAVAPMLRALLVERFKMTYHTEQRPVSAYTLVALKPKMKKADPNSRIWCKNGLAPPGAPPGSQMISCQNISMAQFAEHLQNMAPGLNWPVLDATEIDGGWDFTLIYSRNPAMMMAAGRGGDTSQPASVVPLAADPTGGYTIFEAVEKQLGLKLETQKRSIPVIVIDHLEQKPTEN